MACADAGDACMGLDWSADAARNALTGTSGKAYVGDAAADGALRLVTEWQAHDLECWCAAFDPRDVNCLYTGADDAMLKRWDLRCDNDESEPASTACNRRTHRAGVCCISPSRKREHILATGSYDETARLGRAAIGAAAVRGRVRWRRLAAQVASGARRIVIGRVHARRVCRAAGVLGGERGAVARAARTIRGARHGSRWDTALIGLTKRMACSQRLVRCDRQLHAWKYSVSAFVRRSLQRCNRVSEPLSMQPKLQV